MRRALILLTAAATFAAGCSGASDDAATESPAPTTSAADEATSTTTTTTVTLAPTTTMPAITPVGLCDDIEVPVPTVIGPGIGGTNIPDSVREVVRAYTDQHLDVYATRWTDRDHGGTFVVAFTDDPENHREALLDMRSETEGWALRDSGYAVDVVQLDFSNIELQAAADVIRATLNASPDFELHGSGSGNSLNRVTLLLDRPTEETLAELAELLPDYAAMMCVEGQLWDESMAPPPRDEPLGLLDMIDDDPLVTCRGLPPFRVSLLEREPDVDPTSSDPLIVALLAKSMSGFPPPTNDWRTIERTAETASFARFEDGPNGLAARTHSFTNTIAGWTISGEGAGTCDLAIPLPQGIGYMNVGLDPAVPLDRESATLHLVVSQVGCASGRSGIDKMYPPEVQETETEIRIAIAVGPPDGGVVTCQGNDSAPVVIGLGAPIGDRTIVDAIKVPAAELQLGIDR